MLDEVKKRRGTFGYNAQTEQYGDMLEIGIVDPTKVVSTAFQNAASIAALRITTEAMMAILPQDQPLAGASRMVGEM